MLLASPPVMKIDDQLEEAFREVQSDNTHRMNRVRAIGVGFFVVIAALIAFVIAPVAPEDREAWTIVFYGALIYFVIALGLFLGSRRHPAVLHASRFTIPIIDIPVIVAIQAISILNTGSNPGNFSEFTISLFACCILLSTFTLDLRQVGITVVVAIVGEQILQHLAGVSLGGRLGSVAVFGIVAWICVFAKQTRVDLVTRVTQANARRARLQRYFSPGVGELIERHDDHELSQGRECDLTIVFTDIRGFTRISESLSGPDVIRFLNHYHARMVEAVFQYGGTLDKYLGDGLMIYFNAPVEQVDHAQRAIGCALHMLQEVADLNASGSWHGSEQIRIGIGIHSGRAVLGDIGAPHRREFTAIGDAVNVAARLQEMTKELGHDIVVSGTTEALVEDEFSWKPLGEIQIRNRDEPLRVAAPSLTGD